MLKLTKKADYGLIALKHLAETAHATDGANIACSAKDIAEAYDIPQEALAKILQRLVKSGFLISHHGINGGYLLSRRPQEISAFEVIRAIDGPLFITVQGETADDQAAIGNFVTTINDTPGVTTAFPAGPPLAPGLSLVIVYPDSAPQDDLVHRVVALLHRPRRHRVNGGSGATANADTSGTC